MPALQKLGPEALENLAAGRTATIEIDGEPFVLEAGDVVIEHIPLPGLVVASESGILTALETKLSEALILEGRARDFVNKVQNLRKTKELEVSQRIRLRVAADPEVRRAVEAMRDYVMQETLCMGCEFVAELPASDEGEPDLNGLACRIELHPADNG